MKNILFTCFRKTDSMYVDYLQMCLDEVENYEKNMKITGILTPKEADYFKFIISSFQSAGETPSQTLFEQNFHDTVGAFAGSVEIQIQDLRVYIFNLIDKRVNRYIHDAINILNQRVKNEGLTEEITDELARLQTISNRNKAKDVEISIDAKAEYDLMKASPVGLRTGIDEVDKKVGGLLPGTVTTIAGFTSQFKTTWALNIAHLNSYNFGYNLAYISLETPKKDMMWNLLSLHSFSDHLSKYQYVPHDKIRSCSLDQDEDDYVFNVVQKDLEDSTVTGEDGKVYKRGKIVILDESDFNTFSFGEITATLEEVDDKLKKEGYENGLDGVIVDYVQLCKFSGAGMAYDANSQINSYVTFFRRLAQCFRKVVDANGDEHTKQLVMILLAQLNRTGWLKASRNNGRYDLTALADANELERGSSRIFTTFTTEELKARNSAQVQILKNRQGQTMYDPTITYVVPEAYVFTNEAAGQGMTFGGQSGPDAFSSMSAIIGGGLGDDLGVLGI